MLPHRSRAWVLAVQHPSVLFILCSTNSSCSPPVPVSYPPAEKLDEVLTILSWSGGHRSAWEVATFGWSDSFMFIVLSMILQLDCKMMHCPAQIVPTMR